LLAKPDAVRITTPALPRETMERVLQIIRKDVAEDKVRIDIPTQNLEAYFLQVVQNARKAAAETSGATSGARVAAYLRGDQEAKPAGDRILERLTAPQPETPAPSKPAAPMETIDRKRLDALAQPTEPAETRTPAPAPEKKAELEKANEKLSSLLNKPGS
jgi:ABC-2 type transport system ATP-binding protein